ncbi:MAG TPA: carboxypeptidase-like regulatory domain-containing protein, partial [Ginsengibacter sp.]
MIEKSKIYTAADFERYHSGAMSVNEMHEIEKAALEDPFLADALEGYTYALSFENDIKQLKEKINEKQKKKNVFLITSITQSGWWRIVALFIIIAGAGYFFYKTNYKNKGNSLAKNEIKSIAQKKDSATINSDTNSITNDLAFENQQLPKDEGRKKNSLPANKPLSGKEVIANNKIDATASLPAPENQDKYYSDSIKLNLKSGEIKRASSPQYSLKGKVTNENGKPLAFATVENKSKNETAITDTTGRFSLPSPDSNATAIVSVIGYGTKKVALQKDKEPVITMNKSEANLDETVDAGVAQSKKLNDATTESKDFKSKVSGLTASPLSTFDNTEEFNDYLKKNVKPVLDENNSKLNGDVLLSF